MEFPDEAIYGTSKRMKVRIRKRERERENCFIKREGKKKKI